VQVCVCVCVRAAPPSTCLGTAAPGSTRACARCQARVVRVFWRKCVSGRGGFPSIYLLKDGSTWQYTGVRTVADVSLS
jgi:hypothetical protein